MSTMLPQNIATGGEVTLLRIVGTIGVAEQIENAIAGGFPTRETSVVETMFSTSIQLVQIRHGALGTGSLDAQDGSDLDSSNFLWRHDWIPGAAPYSITTQNILGGAGDQFGMLHKQEEIDIRVKRRFDRSQWALVLNGTVLIADVNQWAMTFSFRGLFLTSGGI